MTPREFLEAKALEKGGELTPEEIVDLARPKASPIHQYFTWNKDKAHHDHLLHEARLLIKRIKVNVIVTDSNNEERKIQVRAFVSLPKEDQERAYVPVSIVMNDEAMRGQVLMQIVNDLLALRRKHAAFEDLFDLGMRRVLGIEDVELDEAV